MAIDRIGGNGKVDRDTASAGFAALDRQETAEARAPKNEKVDEVAKLYEKQFLREMVKAMRGTVSYGAQKPSMAENIYRDQLDEQYVESWGDLGGVGLSDLIYSQIMDRYFASPAGQKLKAQGAAIPLTDREVSKVMRVKSGAGPGQVPLRVEVAPSAQGKSAQVLAPWDSEVVSNSRLEGGKTALTLSHGPDLRSTFIFNGVPSGNASPGTRFEKGKPIGVLSPEAHSFFWNLAQLEVGQPVKTEKQIQ